MSQKKTVFDKLIQAGKTESELNEKYNEFFKEAKTFGFDDAASDTHALRRLIAFYSKRVFGGKTSEFKCVVLGMRKSDYGATKYYKSAKTLFAANPDQAVAEGYTDEEGNPLYEKGFNKGKKIDIAKVWTKQYYGIAALVTDGKPSQFLPATVNIGDEAYDQSLPVNQLLTFDAVGALSKDKDRYGISLKKKFDIKSAEKLESAQLTALVNEYFKPVKFSELEAASEALKDKFDTFVLVKGDVVSIKVSEDPEKSHILNITDPEVDLSRIGEEGLVSDLTCWLPFDTNIDFSESANDVIVIGRPAMNAERQVSLQAIAVIVPDMYRKRPTSPVTPDGAKQAPAAPATTPEKKQAEDDSWVSS